MTKKNALGRGLGALIDGVEKEVLERKVEPNMDIPLDSIDGNPFQPRSHFDEQSLEELATSIRKLGIVQPLTVRETGNGRYQLIAGERRLRAARLAGLTQIPAYIRTADDQAMLELALVENIQREDLDAVEVAIRAYDPCLSCATHALGKMPLEFELYNADNLLIERKFKN